MATAITQSNPKVLDMVRAELEKNPAVRTDELFERARKLDKATGSLTVRQFHARYPLQVKRKLAAGRRPRRRARRRGAGADRGAIRSVLLDFAREVASADGKAQIVELIGGVEKYVDRVAKAAGAAA
jgi:hypothetical protein